MYVKIQINYNKKVFIKSNDLKIQIWISTLRSKVGSRYKNICNFCLYNIKQKTEQRRCNENFAHK
jgi:hypothetical protein